MASSVSQNVSVTTTYLEILELATFRPALLHEPDLLVLEAREPLVGFYRFLYDAVGRDYVWTDRLAWSDSLLDAHLRCASVALLVLYFRGTPAGFAELERASEEPGTEIAYFGIIPAFHGRGFGRHLLSTAVRRAFDDGAARVWLHTCSLDGPYALANYRARGFIAYKTTMHEQAVGRASTESEG